MEFLHPIYAGDALSFESTVIANGRSTLTVYTKVTCNKTPERIFCDGFATFVHVNDDTVPQPHGIVITPTTEEEARLQEEAKALVLKSKEKKWYLTVRLNWKSRCEKNMDEDCCPLSVVIKNYFFCKTFLKLRR